MASGSQPGACFLFLTFLVSPVSRVVPTADAQTAARPADLCPFWSPLPPHTPLGLAGLTQFGVERRACLGAHLPV